MAPIVRSGSPIDYYKPHPRGKEITGAQKQTVLNVYFKLRQQHPGMNIEDVVDKTAELTGVSSRSVFRIKLEFQTSGGNLRTKPKKRRGNSGKRARMVKYNYVTLSAIRKQIHGFLSKGQFPSARKVCSVVNDDPELPSFSLSTMQRLMKDLGYSYKKCDSNTPEKLASHAREEEENMLAMDAMMDIARGNKDFQVNLGSSGDNDPA